ncbi:hypothetical protein [Abyssisolibacter fermentans]|uniref:hypothetical protein n=1 Tax=Abyssisolibacter fermentans TaxID=1766203 RepID=UPI00083465BC|nr:hypothetical protein [Abyssisolibacter fermentans]
MTQTIMGIKIDNRNENVPKVQNLFTEYGCIINTRLGLHEAHNLCSPQGLILLEVIEEKNQEVDRFEAKLNSIEGVVVKKMVF